MYCDGLNLSVAISLWEPWNGMWCFEDLNENIPYRLICLNAWSLVSGTVQEGFGGVVLLEEGCHWG